MMASALLPLWSAFLICLMAAKTEGSYCFPGLQPCMYNATQCCCKQDSFNGYVKCHPDGSSVIPTTSSGPVCITYGLDYIVAGICPYLRPGLNNSLILPQKHIKQKELSKMMCKSINRKGRMCGKCADKHVLSVNTYDFKCLPHESCASVNWLLYFLTKYGPLTCFYLIIFLFRINAAAPYISLLILLSQIITTRNNILKIIGCTRFQVDTNLTSFFITLYSVWNLDVLQMYMPPLCLKTNTDNLSALALDYLVAFYPLILVLVTYGLAELHARRWWCVFWFFWPIAKLFKCLHINIDPMRSIMNTFATFILLSITKFTIVSINLLTYIPLVDVNGTIVRHVPLYDGDTEYFGSRHLPYAILAIVVLFFCNLIPVLLLFLSPLKCFQRCLRWCCCSFRCVHFISAFLEVFQGHFKDRVSHRKDYRFVAGLQFLLRFVMLLGFSSALSFEIVCTSTIVALMLWSVGGLILRPYKRELYNILEAVLGTYGAFFLALLMYYYINTLKGSPKNIVFLYVSAVTPGLLFLLYTFVHIIQLCGCHVKLGQFLDRSFATANHFISEADNERQGYEPFEDIPPPLQENNAAET